MFIMAIIKILLLFVIDKYL